MNMSKAKIISAVIIIVAFLFLPHMQKALFAATSDAKEKYKEANASYLELAHDAAFRKDKAHWMKVVKEFDEIATEYPDSSYAPKALYMKGKLYEQIYGHFSKKTDLEEALKAYKKVVSKYPDSPVGADALYKEAKAYEVRLGDQEKARGLYHEIVIRYPKSTVALQARQNLQTCNTGKVNKDGVTATQDSPRKNDQEENKGNQATSSHDDTTVSKRESGNNLTTGTTSQEPSQDQPSLNKQTSHKIFKIVIDPGHGGKDPGAIGPHGEKEKDITLAVGIALAKRLREKGFEVFLTRDDDIFIPLEERTAFANKKKADLFISIHVNSNSKKSLNGVETYFLNMTKDDYAIKVAEKENETTTKSLSDLQFIIQDLMLNSKINESSKFATYVQNAIISTHRQSDFPCQNHGVKQALFYVLVGAQMPAILIETGFITNPTECKLLQKESYQNSIIEGIIKGINFYANNQADSGVKNKQ